MIVEITTTGTDAASRRFTLVGERGEDPRPALRVIAEDWAGLQREYFESRGSGRWKPNAPATVANKRRKGQDVRVMFADGKLFASLTEPRKRFTVRRVRSNMLVFGTSAGVAKLHHKGVPALKIPARPLLAIDAEAVREAGERIVRYVVDGDAR